MPDKILITIIGPTAIGKTSLAIKIAKNFQTEIISCDSRQFFKEMKIGTAIPSDEELSMVKHHFIANKSIQDNYSVGDFEKEALSFIDDYFKNHDNLVMVGGSGLYEKAINEGLDIFPEIDLEIKKEVNFWFEEYGLEYLQNKLKEIDLDYFYEVDIQNPMRLIRALEVSLSTNIPFSSFRKNQKKSKNFKTIKIGLSAPREIIYDKINRRVDIMIESGLINEVKSLIQYRELNALQTVGYKEIFDFLDGKISLDFAIEEIKKNTRRYAKRQLTWYRKDSSVNWFEYKETDKILDFISSRIL